jgi:hypothetical protein
MKRAPFILVTIAVMALVSAALAFKIRRGAIIYCSTTTTHTCTQIRENYTITLVPIGPLSYCTTEFGSYCTTLTYITFLE